LTLCSLTALLFDMCYLVDAALDRAHESQVEYLTVRLDGLRLTYPSNKWRAVLNKEKNNNINEPLEIEVEFTVRNGVTIDVKHKDRVIGTHTTSL